MLWRIPSLLFAFLCAAPVCGQAMQPAAPVGDLAAALALPVATGLVGARDTARFAWVENAAGARNIWVADRGKPARRLTDFSSDDGLLIYDLELSRDGAALVFVRGGDEEYPDEEDRPNTGAANEPPAQLIYLARPDGTEAATRIGDGHSPTFSPSGDRIAFTRRGEIWLWDRQAGARRIATLSGELSRLAWSPDGSHLAFVDNRRDHSFIGLLRIGAERVEYVDPGLGYSVEPAFSPDGRQLAFIRFADPPAGASPGSGSYWSICIADVETGAARQIWAAPAGRGGRYAGTRSRNLFWGANGKLVFPWEASGQLHPYALDAKGAGEPVDLARGAPEVESFLLAPDGRALVYAAGNGDPDTRLLWRVPLTGGRPEALTRGSGLAFAPTYAGNVLGLIATDADSPAHPVLADDGLRPLGRVATLSNVVAPESVTFRAEDGVEVHAQLFHGRGRGRHPALVFVHGGPRRQMLPGFHPSGYYSNAYILNQHFAAQGYDVLAVNYRSGTGYGLAFREAPNIAREGAAEYRDILAAGRWLAARPDVDTARIGIWGGSWGGYLTALALARNSELFAAGADFHGVHAMVRPVDNNLSPDAQAAAQRLQWQSSPMGSIGTWRSPVLLVHGDDDQNVAFSQSLLLVRELKARAIPHRELVFPNERHGFFRYADWLAAYRATEAFFAETLGAK